MGGSISEARSIGSVAVGTGAGDETVEGTILIPVTGGRTVAVSVPVGVKVTCGMRLVGTTGITDGGSDEGLGFTLSEADSVGREAGPVLTEIEGMLNVELSLGNGFGGDNVSMGERVSKEEDRDSDTGIPVGVSIGGRTVSEPPVPVGNRVISVPEEVIVAVGGNTPVASEGSIVGMGVSEGIGVSVSDAKVSEVAGPVPLGKGS